MRNDATASATWWQWMLLYPSLVATLLSAVPSWIDHIQAANIGVKTSDLAQAKEQKRLWETNLDCTRAQEIQRIRTPPAIRKSAPRSAPQATSWCSSGVRAPIRPSTAG